MGHTLLYFTLLYFIRANPANAKALGPCTMRAGVHVTKFNLSEGYGLCPRRLTLPPLPPHTQAATRLSV